MTPATFGKYVVTEQLGSGGMAEVYAGIHPDLGRKVAIKVILPQFATERNFEERFRREARLVASLRHAHIVRLYDFDVMDGRYFMVMEYLEGGTLKEQLRDHQQRQSRMALPAIADLLDAMASALDYAHERGAIHRDIKPANILFTAEHEPVLTDFGIAKLLEDAAHLTATGGVVGSPFYIPPEQASGAVVDARSDQYALGVVLYEMAAGRVPFQGSTAVAVMTQHLNSAPPSPRAFNAALSPAIEAVLLKALAKRPDDRFGSCGELAQAFRAALDGHSVALPASTADERTELAAPTLDAATVDAATGDAATVVDTGKIEAPEQAVSPIESATENTVEDTAATAEQREAAASAPMQPAAMPPSQAAEQPPASLDRASPPAAPRPTAQTFNVGGIQAGIVNQGGEQTFSGDLTFNLDFGELKAAPAQEAAPARAAAGGDAPQLAALLEALRRAFAGSARVDRFVRLVTQFETQLEALPPQHADERQQVVKRVQALLMEMTQAKPDPDLVEIMGTSLERAVQPLSGVDPDLPPMATRITSWGELLVQPE